jgi:methylglutaconyl-CoA hydratase
MEFLGCKMLHIESFDDVIALTLDRQSKHNALNQELLDLLQAALDEIKDNAAIKVVLLKSTGPNFCSGADLSSFADSVIFTEKFSNLLYTLHKLPQPSVAMVQGKALGGGIGLFAACDYVITTDDALFSFPEVSINLIPAMISPYIIKNIGAKKALSLFLSCETINAKQALALGLIQHVTTQKMLWQESLAYAKNIAKFPAAAVQITKKLVYTVADMPMDDNLRKYTAKLLQDKLAHNV